MRQFLIALIILLTHFMGAEGHDMRGQATKKRKTVSFQTTIEIKNATKDGIYLNGYVVNIPYEQLEKLNGKTVRISGKVTIVKGNRHYREEEVRQGRFEDTKHILKPKVQVIRS